MKNRELQYLRRNKNENIFKYSYDYYFLANVKHFLYSLACDFVFLMNELLVPETNVGLIPSPPLLVAMLIFSFNIYIMPYVLLINTLVVVGATMVTLTGSYKAYKLKNEVEIRNIFRVWNIYGKSGFNMFFILFGLFFIVYLLIMYNSINADDFISLFVSPLVTTLFYIMLGGINGVIFVRYLRNNTEKKPSTIYYILQFLPVIDVISARNLLRHTELYNLEK